jgi:hypothetical protein
VYVFIGKRSASLWKLNRETKITTPGHIANLLANLENCPEFGPKNTFAPFLYCGVDPRIIALHGVPYKEHPCCTFAVSAEMRRKPIDAVILQQ